jgi:DNA-binding CsgD family transcriptional regulator
VRTCASFISITINSMIDAPRGQAAHPLLNRRFQTSSRLVPRWNHAPGFRLLPRWTRLLVDSPKARADDALGGDLPEGRMKGGVVLNRRNLALKVLGHADALEGLDSAGREHAHTALDRWACGEERHSIVHIARGLSSLLAGWSDTAGIARCVDALSTAASVTRQAEALAALAHGLAERHMREDRPDDAMREFASSPELLGGLPVRAAELQRYTEALFKVGDTAWAALRLREAVDLWRSLSAAPLLQRALSRLREVPPATLHAADERDAKAGLTPRQLQILSHVARGKSDKQIARELSLSPRTVEMHMGRLLTTLQCRSGAGAVLAGRRATAVGLTCGL